MTTFIKPPKRPATEHDEGCTRPGWLVQQRVVRRGPLIAQCAGCSAVRKVTERDG